MTQEDTSYHRINQGSGPQLKVVWTWKEVVDKRDWWSRNDRPAGARDPSPAPLHAKRDSLTVNLAEIRERASSRSPSPSERSIHKDAVRAGETPLVYSTGQSSSVSEGTTDKWFMDRWQCEVLAVACVHHISIKEASYILTVAYFGYPISIRGHVVLAVFCTLLTVGTFVAAELMDWFWAAQFVALSSLGYFTNRMASLRGWRFQPNQAIKDELPQLVPDWPRNQNGSTYVRIAVQSSGFCHLRGLVSISKAKLDEARDIARQMRGR